MQDADHGGGVVAGHWVNFMHNPFPSNNALDVLKHDAALESIVVVGV